MSCSCTAENSQDLPITLRIQPKSLTVTYAGSQPGFPALALGTCGAMRVPPMRFAAAPLAPCQQYPLHSVTIKNVTRNCQMSPVGQSHLLQESLPSRTRSALHSQPHLLLQSPPPPPPPASSRSWPALLTPPFPELAVLCVEWSPSRITF